MHIENTDESSTGVGEVTEKHAEALKHALIIGSQEEESKICILADETDEDTQKIIADAKAVLGEANVEVMASNEYEKAKAKGHKTIILIAGAYGSMFSGVPNLPTDDEIIALSKRLDEKMYLKPMEIVADRPFFPTGSKDNAKPFDGRVSKKKGGFKWRR